MEKYIVKRVNAVLHTTDAQIVHRLEGGMSNYTYVVSSKGVEYTYRVPGKNAEVFVNREDELFHIQAVESLGLNNKTLYFDIPSGEKLALYVEGQILSNTDVVSYNEVSAEALKKIHQSQVKLLPYNAFTRLDQYENLCKQMNYVFPETYKVFRGQLNEMRVLYQNEKMVPCHCDYQPTNLVMGKDQMYVLDWEFSGMNDPYYDIACYGNVGIDKAVLLLETYLQHKPSHEELKHLYFHRIFQCLQWFNVAIYKNLIGLSKELNMDFNQVAFMFLGFAESLLNEIKSLK